MASIYVGAIKLIRFAEMDPQRTPKTRPYDDEDLNEIEVTFIKSTYFWRGLIGFFAPPDASRKGRQRRGGEQQFVPGEHGEQWTEEWADIQGIAHRGRLVFERMSG